MCFIRRRLRDLLMQLAVMDFFWAKWTNEIHEEWISSLLRNTPRFTRSKLEHTRDLMNDKVRDCLVVGHQPLISSIVLPDPGDRHVLAAAVFAGCDLIVTHNLKHFPKAVLAAFDIRAQHPDEFLTDLLEQGAEGFCEAVRRVRRRLENSAIRGTQNISTFCGAKGLSAWSRN